MTNGRVETKWIAPLRALLWKEWRQQRQLCLAAVLVPGLVSLGWQRLDPFNAGFVAAVLCAGLIMCFMASVMVEEDDQIAALLANLPVGRERILAVKVGMTTAVAVAAIAVLAGAVRIGPSGEETWLTQLLGPTRIAEVAVAFAFALGLTTAVASAGLGVLPTLVLGCALTPCALWFYLGTPVPWLYRAFYDSTGYGWSLFGIGLVGLGAVGIWVRRGTTARGRCTRLAFVALLPPILVLLPVAWAWARPVLFWSADDYYPMRDLPGRKYGIDAYAYAPPVASPDKVLVHCHLRWVRGNRVALLDLRTGTCRWLDRLHANSLTSFLWEESWVAKWSPDGTRCLVYTSLRFLWPGAPASSWVDRSAGGVYILDLGTATLTPLIEPTECPGPPPDFSWFDNAILFSSGGNHARDCVGREPLSDTAALFDTGMRGYQFANLSTHRGGFCAKPPEREPNPRPQSSIRDVFREEKTIQRFGAAQVTERGFIECTKEVSPAGVKVQILRYHPDLAQAEEIKVGTALDSYHPLHRYPVNSISADGMWLLAVSSERGVRGSGVWGQQIRLVSLSGGAPVDLVHPAGLDLAVPMFRPRRLDVLCLTPAGPAAYDVVAKTWRTYPVSSLPRELITKSFWRWTVCSPSGRYVLVALGRGTVCVTLDLETGASWPVRVEPESKNYVLWSWLGDDRLLMQTVDGVWVCNRDGTGKRRLLPRE